MRRMIGFDCEGARLAATLDEGVGTTGLLIVSGGNEIRSGAHAGQAAMATHFTTRGHPVFRYDRRGIGESEGANGGFESSGPDVAAAVAAFRREAPSMQRLVAYGNCDAASALAFFHNGLEIDALILANPWVIENAGDEGAAPTASAIRARYLSRLKNPRSLIDLFSGRINLRKLAGGVVKATQTEKPTGLAATLAGALEGSKIPVTILIAERDTTAMAFMAVWRTKLFETARAQTTLRSYDTASHSFADEAAKAWLLERIGEVLDR